MSDNPAFDVHVCLGCPGGEALCHALSAVFAGRTGLGGARVAGYSCLGGCSRRGRVSIAANGRWSWLFGGIVAGQSSALADFAALWLQEVDGLVPRPKRPEAVRNLIIGRLPPPGEEG